jgi:ankyrin repeat protein
MVCHDLFDEQLAITQLLIAAGADVNSDLAINGETPLTVAAFNNAAAVTRALVAAGADVNKARAVDGARPIDVTARCGRAAHALLLLELGAECMPSENSTTATTTTATTASASAAAATASSACCAAPAAARAAQASLTPADPDQATPVTTTATNGDGVDDDCIILPRLDSSLVLADLRPELLLWNVVHFSALPVDQANLATIVRQLCQRGYAADGPEGPSQFKLLSLAVRAGLDQVGALVITGRRTCGGAV